MSSGDHIVPPTAWSDLHGATASGKLDGEPEGPDTTRTTERPVQPRLPDAAPARPRLHELGCGDAHNLDTPCKPIWE